MSFTAAEEEEEEAAGPPSQPQPLVWSRHMSIAPPRAEAAQPARGRSATAAGAPHRAEYHDPTRWRGEPPAEAEARVPVGSLSVPSAPPEPAASRAQLGHAATFHAGAASGKDKPTSYYGRKASA